MQNEDSTHVPAVPHFPEQHSPEAPHLLPLVLQLAVRALHVPPAQFPPQHELLAVHAAPSEVHWLALQAPFTQLNVAQSVFALHAPLVGTGFPSTDVQVWLVMSHLPEQQVPSAAHASPVVPQAGPTDESGPPGPMTEPSVMSPPPPLLPPPPPVVVVAAPEPPQLKAQRANANHHQEYRDIGRVSFRVVASRLRLPVECKSRTN